MKHGYIIFADDDADDLELITGYFRQYNPRVEVLELRDGKEVIKFLSEATSSKVLPKLIVLDINMPRLNGKDTLIALRKDMRFKHIPVVIYTTSSNKADEAFCKKYQASWLSKPETIDGIKKAARIMAEFCEI